MIKRIAVLTSGGDSSGMNPCIRSVVRNAIFNGLTVMGVQEGYKGLLNNQIFEMDEASVSGIINRGGTILYSSRCEEFRTVEGRKQAIGKLREHSIDALVVIGGDGSYRGINTLRKEFDFPVIGIPGTIDNDIMGTDYTIGYDTAVNVAMEAIDKIRDTATSHGRLFLVEVMGRHAGYIALEVGIASGAEEILIPETITNFDEMIENLERGRNRGKRSSIVVVAEGEETGGAYTIAKRIEGKTGYKMRVVILGHMQRGGPPTAYERLMASRFGYYAVKALLDGSYGVAIGIQKGEVTYTDIEDATTKPLQINTHDFELAQALSI
jgi:6-phosphofructokinase 1